MNIGLITFHGSHNYGSVLQAYATQKLLEEKGDHCEIINFRMKSQLDYYSLYTAKYGLLTLGQEILMLPEHRERKRRSDKFEHFITKRFSLSGRALHTYKDLKEVSTKYDLYVTGSDQIWSDGIPELVHSDKDYTGAYFLDFVDKKKPRFAFSSSIGEIPYERLLKKKELLDRFDAISTREQYGVDVLERITKKDVTLVLDPTLVYPSEKWRKLEKNDLTPKGKYIFLYTLHGYKNGRKWREGLSKLAERLKMPVVCVSPFFPIHGKNITTISDAGPEEFLSLIDHAELVFTDSFHGTAFSVNFNKQFYSLTGTASKDNRKVGLLRELGLEQRCLSSYDDIAKIQDYSLDYTTPNMRLEERRNGSREFLFSELDKVRDLI